MYCDLCDDQRRDELVRSERASRSNSPLLLLPAQNIIISRHGIWRRNAEKGEDLLDASLTRHHGCGKQGTNAARRVHLGHVVPMYIRLWYGGLSTVVEFPHTGTPSASKMACVRIQYRWRPLV